MRNESKRAFLRALGGLAAASGLSGCAGVARGPAVPVDRADRATILGTPNARFRGPQGIAALDQEAQEALERQRRVRGLAAGATLPPLDLLAVSGGGDDGAFGAGVINGWTEAGNRPVFDLVTGISTGGLTAPFAFLGSAYDPQLRSVYTQVSQSNILSTRWLPTALFSDALADNAPLFGTISQHLNEAMLADIARGYDEGRLLLIFSTDLDAQLPVCWNIGAIAKSGHPGALDVVRRILLASAAVPGAFPPVMFDVEVDGQRYQEMHVDGGAFAQLFLYPAALTERRREAIRLHRPVLQIHAYVIRNAKLDPSWSSVSRRFLSITARAVSTMITASGINDVVRTYQRALEDGVDFNLAYIGSDFQAAPHEDFDPHYMQSLYDYGYQRARHGYDWAKVPPMMRLMPAGTTAAQPY
jgi:predicted acylesterase/phospholipase RssA